MSEERAVSPPADSPLTFTRLVGAFVIASSLFFVLLVLFALAGFGSLGLAPAIVVAVALTGRIAHVRRTSALLLIGVLAFLSVVVLTYTIAVLAVLNARSPTG